jgi:uncharacterized membrane protein
MIAERTPAESRLVASVILLFGAGASLASAVYLAGYDRVLEHVMSNAMDRSSRDVLLAAMVGAGTFAVLAGAVFLAIRRFSDAGLTSLLRAARIVSPLIVVFPLPVLFDYRWTQRNEWAFVLAAGLFGLALERALRLSFGSIDWASLRDFWARSERRHPHLHALAPPSILTLMVVSAATYLGYFTILNHYRLGTASWDLAIFDNMMWNLIRGSWFAASPDLGRTGSHIQFHANFLAYLYAPFYAIYQQAESLLVIQAVTISTAAIPIYLIAKRRLGNAWAALVIAYAYLIHAPMHGPVFYDFHFATLAPFWVAWVAYFYEVERKGWLIATWICAMLLREDTSAVLSAGCLFHLTQGKRARWALIGGIVSALYFLVVKFIVMPLHRTWSDANSFTWMFQGLIPPGETGFKGVLRTMGSNPVFTFNSLLEQDKLTYIIKMMGPVLVLPFRHPRTWILFIPPAMFTLLSWGYKPLYQTFFQYTSSYSAYIFFAACITMSWWRQRDAVLGERTLKLPAAVLAILATATVYSYSHGAMFQRESFVGGFRQIRFEISKDDRRRHKDLYDLIKLIPRDASVAATEMEAPHVSNRRFCFTLRFAYEDADYLLMNLDEARTGSTNQILKGAIATGKYGFVTRRGNFALWKRGGDQARNAQGKQMLGLP